MYNKCFHLENHNGKTIHTTVLVLDFSGVEYFGPIAKLYA